MIFHVLNYHLLEECTKDILSVIKPAEEDQNKRLGAVKEIVNSVGAFRGVARDLKYILAARVPVLKYVSNHYGVPCDISIDNYSGRIKSRALYWITTIDERFGDMVLLVKEWARAQNINDPKNGTLSSYALCVLVISHFQHGELPILPPLREIFIMSIVGGSGGFNEKYFDQIWEENIAKFRRQNIGRLSNRSSLSRLLAGFFRMNSLDYPTYYSGRTQVMTKSSCTIINDLFDRSEDAAMITVDVPGLQHIVSAFKRATDIIDSYDDPPDRNTLVSLLCTPKVCSKLGARAAADRYTGSTGGGPVRRTQGYSCSGRQAAAPY